MPRPSRPRTTRWRGSPRSCGSGSRRRSPRRPPRRPVPGRRSPRATTPWSSRPPAPARRSPRSCLPSTRSSPHPPQPGMTPPPPPRDPARIPSRPAAPRWRSAGPDAAACSMCRPSRHWPWTSSATCGPRWRGSPRRPPPTARPCAPSTSQCAPATHRRRSGRPSPGAAPTSSSRPRNRCSCCSPAGRARRSPASTPSSSTRSTRSPAPNVARTSLSRWTGWMRSWSGPPNGSACRPPCAPPRRSPGIWPAGGR